MLPIQKQARINGVELAWWEWPGQGPPLLFAHATGFHGRCWDAVINRLPGRHCYALDARGHGRSAKPAPPYRWRVFGEDVAALGQALGLRGAIGVGHSNGGYAVTLAAALNRELFSALLLIDPVIFPRAWYGHTPAGEHFAARRRNRWASADDMVERFKDRPPFNRWQPDVLRDYCRYGLLPAEDGDGFVLACPPAIEAAIYPAGSAADADMYDEIATIDIPVIVLRAGGQLVPGSWDMEASPTAPDLTSHFRHGSDIELTNHRHFIPMEDPALVVDYIIRLAPGRNPAP